MQVPSLGQEDPLEEEMAMHSNILAWEIPWERSPVGCSPWGCRVRHDLATKQQFIHIDYDTNEKAYIIKKKNEWWRFELGGVCVADLCQLIKAFVCVCVCVCIYIYIYIYPIVFQVFVGGVKIIWYLDINSGRSHLYQFAIYFCFVIVWK